MAALPTSTQHARTGGRRVVFAPQQGKNLTKPGHRPLGAPTPLPPQGGDSRSPASFIMTKGATFAVNAAHTVTHAPIAEASTPNGAPPASAPNPLPSTLRPLIFARLLQHHPNHQFTATLLTHLTHGFDIGYQGPHRDLRAHNLPSAYEHPEAIDEYLQHEGKHGRIAGPFQEPPFQPFHCSGMGVIPKQDGAWRVITHLSAPDGLSVNDHIDPEAVTLRYATIDDAIRIANQLGAGTLLAKIDLKKAFRQCPVRPADWHLLGLQWRGQYYYDKCLPFGLRSSPFLFDTVATALEYIFRHHLNNQHIIHYLDDFLIAGPPHSPRCGTTFDGVEALCKHLGIQTKAEKRTPPITCITFLGIELNTITQIARLPQAKLTAILQELTHFKPLQKCTKRALLSLIGKLAFAAKVIPAGRIFVRRLINASTTVHALHYHLRLSAATKADIEWWLQFAPTWHGKAFFLDHSWIPSPAFQLYTDASQQGYGCFWQGQWLRGAWTKRQAQRDIQWKELAAVVIAASTWGAQWKTRRLLVHCDNHAVVDIWRKGTSKHAALMQLVRKLFFIAATHNFTLLLQHIQGTDNGIADALSRSQFSRFRSLAPRANADPTLTPAVATSL